MAEIHASCDSVGGLFDELQGTDTDWSLGFAVNCILSGRGLALHGLILAAMSGLVALLSRATRAIYKQGHAEMNHETMGDQNTTQPKASQKLLEMDCEITPVISNGEATGAYWSFWYTRPEI